MSDPSPPPELGHDALELEDAADRLTGLGHPRAAEWLVARTAEGRLPAPPLSPADVWRELLRDECDKLYNQAWCALETIRNADDPDEVMMVAVDEFPSAVEQAYSLAPALAGEHLALLREHREERWEDFVRELGIGTDREAGERVEALGFWEENAEGISDLRRNLFRIVRRQLTRPA
ncbi:MAG: hypothetical protein ABFS86_16440 [Planctomycetota bacterium]